MAESLSDDTHHYSLLKDFRLQIGAEDSSFSLCFWIYLMNPTLFPATIIRQVLNYSLCCFLGCFSFFLSIPCCPQYPFIHFCVCARPCVLEVFGCLSLVFWVWLLDLLMWVGYGHCNKFQFYCWLRKLGQISILYGSTCIWSSSSVIIFVNFLNKIPICQFCCFMFVWLLFAICWYFYTDLRQKMWHQITSFLVPKEWSQLRYVISVSTVWKELDS